MSIERDQTNVSASGECDPAFSKVEEDETFLLNVLMERQCAIHQ